jgi:hypothetical protein
MKKFWSLALASAAFCIALPTLASAHDFHGGGRHGGGWHGGGWHGGGWHGGGGHAHWRGPGFAAFVPFPVPVPVPRFAYAPAYAPVYAAPYAPPAYYPAYYGAAVSVPAPFIAVRTPHVAVSIGGFFPY